MRRFPTTPFSVLSLGAAIKGIAVLMVLAMGVSALSSTNASAFVRTQTVPVPVGAPPISGVGTPPGGNVVDTVPAVPSTIAPIQAGPTSSTSSTTSTTVPAPPASDASTTISAPITTVAVTAGSTDTTVATPVTSAAAATPAQLRQQVLAVLATGGAGRSAVIVVDGDTVVDLNGTDMRPPASTEKVYTAGTALVQLGADHHFVTTVRATASTTGTTLDGDLILVAGGDPSFTAANLSTLAAEVAATGLRTVKGRLLVDDSHFDRLVSNEGWKQSFVPGEVGPLSAFLVDGNHRSDPATLADPALANLALFRMALTNAGVAVSGALGRGAIGAGGPVLATRTSAPLSELILRMVKKSDNTYAEVILKEIGVAAGTPTAAGGVAGVVRQFDRFGVARPVMADGSGLSSINRTSAYQQVAWMTKLDASPSGRHMRLSLPISCVDGTLRNRMCGTSASGKVSAKTGSIDNVAALTGFTQTAKGRKVVFSMLYSGVPSSARARVAIDKALALVTAYTG